MALPALVKIISLSPTLALAKKGLSWKGARSFITAIWGSSPSGKSMICLKWATSCLFSSRKAS